MRVENTELDYTELEAVGLERYLSSQTETVNQWAQRVWDCCRRQSEGEDVARVYITVENQTWKERATQLWENKKKNRSQAVCTQFGHKTVSDEILTQIKNDPNYKTKEQMLLDRVEL